MHAFEAVHDTASRLLIVGFGVAMIVQSEPFQRSAKVSNVAVSSSILPTAMHDRVEVHAVLVARPQLWGLAVAGQAGVERVLAIYRDEIDRVMGLLGARTLPEIRQLEALVPRAMELAARPAARVADAASRSMDNPRGLPHAQLHVVVAPPTDAIAPGFVVRPPRPVRRGRNRR